MYHNLENLRVIFSDQRYVNRLNKIRQQVRRLWEKHRGPDWDIFHNHTHNEKVETALCSIIRKEGPSSGYVPLSELEWFRLLAAAWLHEIGMIVCLFAEENKLIESKSERDLKQFFNEIRQTHHLRSVQYIEENYESFGIDKSELADILSICRWHRINAKLPGCDTSDSKIRIKLLSAFLKLALIIHLDERALSSDQYQNLLQASGIDWESQFHWFKSSWIEKIKADPDNLKIIFYYYEAPEGHPLRGFLYKRIKNEIEEIIQSVLETLIRGRNSCFLDVVGIEWDELPEEKLYELELIKSNARLEELSSASEAYETVLNTIMRFANYTEPFKIIASYIEVIQQLLEIRPCHNLIRNLVDKIIPTINLKEDESTKVKEIRYMVGEISRRRKEIKTKLSENARVFLMDLGNILVFGYSVSVLDALEFLPDNVKQNTQVFIGECRGKSQFDTSNRILYNDGLLFAKKVMVLGFRHVQIIPDIVIGNLMKRKLIHKVLFGANGIDIDTGSFGHTCGHLSIADLAMEYSIPVYVIADTAKFGKLHWDEALNRDIRWLTNDPKWFNMASEFATLNPREDQVEPDKITTLITEIGAFPPHQIPKSIREKRSFPEDPFKTFFTRAGFEKVELFETNFLRLIEKNGTIAGMAVILWDDAETVWFSDTFMRYIQKLQKNSALYIIYNNKKPLAQKMRTIQKETHCEVIPVAAARIKRAVKSLDDDAIAEELKEIKDPFTTRSDPYFETNPIKDDTWFYGRRMFMERIPADLAQGQHMGLFGLRKVGKTSLIHQIRDRFIKTPTVYIDCQAMSLEAKDYFGEILSQLGKSLQLNGIRTFSKVQLPVHGEIFREHFLRLFKNWKKAERQEPFLLIFDEIDKFYGPEDLREITNEQLEYVKLFKFLRGLYQTYERCLTILVVAYRPDINRKNTFIDGIENPMFESFKEEFLGFLSEDESTKMINEIGLWKDIFWEDGAAAKVFEYCGGHPLVTRFFASQACKQGKNKHIDTSQVVDTAEYICNTFHHNEIGNYYYEGMWKLMKKAEQQLLKQMRDTDEKPFKVTSIHENLKNALSDLVHFGLISDEKGFLNISAGLFKAWISQKEKP
jgi:translation initiation factor 2B subunit (eIF-2B alpha/beta/delta family)/ribosomal protein L12E/L44/L45/RPP1/RPP2